MFLGPYTLFDIVGQNEKHNLKFPVISFEIKEPIFISPWRMDSKKCKEANDIQFKMLLESKIKINRDFSRLWMEVRP